MNLLVITNLYPSSREPARATYNRQLVVALRDLGHELRVIAPVSFLSRPRPPHREVLDNITVEHPTFFYPPKFCVHHHYLFYRLSVRRTWKRTLREFKPDAAILGFIFPDAAAVAPLCEQQRLPYAVRVNGSDFRIRITQPKFRDIILKTLNAAPEIVCPGEKLREEMVNTGIDGQKITAFNNGIDHARFRPNETDDKEATLDTDVLFVGNLVAVKGPERCLEACKLEGESYPRADGERVVPASQSPFHRATPSCLRLRIIGDGPMRGELEKLASNTPVDVRFEGRKPHAEIAQFIHRSRCVCLTSRSEGMPNIVLEALACGKPVVATDVGEVPNLIQDGKNGFVVPQEPNDTLVQRLGAAIQKTLDSEWDSATIARTVQDFTWPQAAETMMRSISSS
jgi:glycosyltransferase involved in cell wall biosynthesis